MQNKLARMVPYWQKLSDERKAVIADFATSVGMVDFLTFQALHAAITRNNIENVCSMLGDRWAERYRKG